MASKKIEDLKSYDWDDAPLIKAYNQATKIDKSVEKAKHPKKKEIERKQWKIGGYCRAKYSVDELMYEAKIISVEDETCLVKFLGYGDREIVKKVDMLPSNGKKARKHQTKLASGMISSGDSQTSDVETASQMSCSNSNNSNRGNQSIVDCAAEDSFQPQPTALETPVAHHYETVGHSAVRHSAANHHSAVNHYESVGHSAAKHHSAVHHHSAANHHLAANHQHAAACFAPPTIPNNMPFLPMAPAPNPPMCPSFAQDPNVSAMLVSWYMAGYYTGFNQGQKGSQCSSSHHCCSHVHKCCH